MHEGGRRARRVARPHRVASGLEPFAHALADLLAQRLDLAPGGFVVGSEQHDHVQVIDGGGEVAGRARLARQVAVARDGLLAWAVGPNDSRRRRGFGGAGLRRRGLLRARGHESRREERGAASSVRHRHGRGTGSAVTSLERNASRSSPP